MKTVSIIFRAGFFVILIGALLLWSLNVFSGTKANANTSDYELARARSEQSTEASRQAAITACKDRTNLRLEKIKVLNAKETMTDAEIAEMAIVKENLNNEACFFQQGVK